MSNNTIEFENKLGELITDTFITKEDFEEAIKYFGNSKISDYLKDYLEDMYGLPDIYRNKEEDIIVEIDT